jgi:hypothetical protein
MLKVRDMTVRHGDTLHVTIIAFPITVNTYRR